MNRKRSWWIRNFSRADSGWPPRPFKPTFEDISLPPRIQPPPSDLLNLEFKPPQPDIPPDPAPN